MLEKGRIPKLAELVADVWVSERHSSRAEVTNNPVEFGASTTDHFFIQPKTLSVSFGVTNTPLRDNSSFGGRDRVSDARDKLKSLQASGEPLTVETISGGYYDNMLIKSISWATDSKSANATNFDIELQEVLITSTETTTYEPLPADDRTSQKASTNKKRGEVAVRSREEANERRSYTADASTSAEELAKSQAAQAQAEKLAESDNKTLLKRFVDNVNV